MFFFAVFFFLQKFRFHQTGAVVLGSLVAVGGLITFIVSIGSNNNGPSLLTFDLIRSSVVIFVAANLSAAAGTGGGGLYTAIFLAIPKMTAHQAMPLSYITVFGVACGSFAFLVQSRHPHAKRPLIDYLLCLIIEPFTLLGAMFGVFLNVTFPSFIIVILLALVLGISAWRTIVKGIQLNAKEISERASVPLQRIAESEGRFPVISNAEEASEFLPADVQEMLEQESRFPWGYFVELFVIWSVLSLLFVLRGGDSSHSSIVGIQCGSTMYWVIVSGTVLFLVLSTGLVLSYTHKLYQKKRFLRYPYLSSDLNWPRKDLIIWPLVSIGVGVAAGFVGISGGMLQAPLLLEMGVLPQVTAATTSFMVLFTSASVSVQYLLLQLLDWRLALWHWALGLVAAFIGQTALDALMKRYQRQSLIAFLLAGLIIICGLTSLIFEGTKLIQGQVKMSFGTPCSPAA
jgi:uncharacterized membrane protein YfcA